jgi:hypothetical protein
VPFAAHGEQDLQQQGAQQLLGGNGGPTGVGVAFFQQVADAGEVAVDQDLQGVQRVIPGHPIL